jgi:hypothetical protein
VASAIWGFTLLVFFVVGFVKIRRRRSSHTFNVGAGAMGSVYDLLNQDKRNAIEIIVEEKAEARDPEDADGNLPELEHPRRSSEKPRK